MVIPPLLAVQDVIPNWVTALCVTPQEFLISAKTDVFHAGLSKYNP